MRSRAAVDMNRTLFWVDPSAHLAQLHLPPAAAQDDIDVANDLPRNGPSGTYSKLWMSRALQSLTSTTPNTCCSASSTAMGPRALGPHTKPTSHSRSSARVGASSPAATWPRGRRTGVPLTTTDDERPW